MALPYWGPGWYSRELTKDLLEQRIVRWDHITHTFSASAHMPATYVRPRLQAIERCWGDHGKQAMNSLFGLMSKAEQKRHYLVCSTEDQDCLSSAPKIVRRAPGDERLWDHICEQRVLTYASWRPIHQRCLEFERLQLARACRIVMRHAKPERIISFHVDAVYFDCSSPKLKAELEAVRYPAATRCSAACRAGRRAASSCPRSRGKSSRRRPASGPWSTTPSRTPWPAAASCATRRPATASRSCWAG
jgi:hypothetical protein